MKIFKYQLAIEIYQTIQMPMGAKVLSAHRQGERLMVWALVDDEQPKISRVFYVCMTGQEYVWPELEKTQFVGTVLFDDGAFVAHVFVKEE